MIYFSLGFIAGALFTCWRYHTNRGALVRQASRVAVVFVEGSEPIGPDLQKLGRIYYGGRL